MDAVSLRHLQFLETIYPDLNCLLRMNPSLNVLVKPKALFNPFAKSVTQTLNFDAVLSFHITLDNHTTEVLLFIDENINYGILDRRGQPFEWKTECLQNGNLTWMEWAYYHINGNETNQICAASHIRIGLDGNIAALLQTLNNYTYGKYSCN